MWHEGARVGPRSDHVSKQPPSETSGLVPRRLGDRPIAAGRGIGHLDGDGCLIADRVTACPSVLVDIHVLGYSANAIDIEMRWCLAGLPGVQHVLVTEDTGV